MRKLAISCALGVLVCIPGAGAAVDVPASGPRGPGDAPTPPQALPAPEHLPPETRAELKARMGRHGESMSNLVRSVVLLDRPAIRALAGRIAEEETVARSSKSLSEKRLLLPREFLAQQTSLSAAARDLAAAADGGDDRTLADQFSALTHTCVSCHSVYLHGKPEGSKAR